MHVGWNAHKSWMRLLPLLLAMSAAARRVATSNLTLEADGVYYSSVWIESQEFTVILDTGSTVLAVPSVECSSCGSGHAKWNKTGSDRRVVSYAEGSSLTYARVVAESVKIDGAMLRSYPVGAIQNETKMFRLQDADGIFGLYGDFTDAARMFSICFRTRTFDVGMSPGDRILWLPLIENAHHGFYVEIDRVGNLKGRRRALIDSGNTGILMPRTDGAPLCEIQFTGFPLITFDRCIPAENVYAGNSVVVLGTSFFKHVPRIVFTKTHIGLGLDADPFCSAYVDARDVNREQRAAAIGVVASYVASVAICIYAFGRPI